MVFHYGALGVDGHIIRRAVVSLLMVLAWCLFTLPLPVIALVALIRARREDIPLVMEALARWRRW